MIAANRKLYSYLMVVLLVAGVSQVNGQVRPARIDPAGLGPRAIFFLLSERPVRKEIGLTVKQSMAITPTLEEFRQEVKDFVTSWPGQQIGEAEFQQRNDKMKQIATKYRKMLKEQISPQQMERLQQIHWQFLGSLALLEDDVAETLKISPEQMDKIREAIKKFDLGPDELKKESSQSFDERLKERDKAATALLSAEQADSFGKLKGNYFDLSTLRSSARRGN